MKSIPVEDMPRPKARRQADEMSEHEHQVLVIQWARLQVKCGTYPDLDVLHAVPNAARRTKGERGWMLSEGMKAGVPDLHLPVPRGGFVGLYIEMKSKGRKLTAAQDWWQDRLHKLGHFVATCFTSSAAIDTLTEYLEGKHRRFINVTEGAPT